LILDYWKFTGNVLEMYWKTTGKLLEYWNMSEIRDYWITAKLHGGAYWITGSLAWRFGGVQN
jgi:hypothetical protein